jgi:16S rRNA (guanine527-N7)-methyltransferase
MLTNYPALPSEQTIRRAMSDFKIELDSQQIALVRQYMGVLLKWNDKVNLTSIRDPLEMLYRHFCESMFAATAVPLKSGRLADVGSGGGFPGLPLKIIRPELEVGLIESNIKKATFLAEVIRDLEISGARVLVNRYEELGEEVAPLDGVCSRALGEHANFLTWAGSPQVAAKQAVLWLGGNDLEEVVSVEGWRWRDPIPIPHSLRRFVLVGNREIEQLAAFEDRNVPRGT